VEKNLENSNFKNLLYKNDQKEIQDFLLENGKEGKVFCPIYFEKNKEEEDGK
jgi:hypothetical protein